MLDNLPTYMVKDVQVYKKTVPFLKCWGRVPAISKW